MKYKKQIQLIAAIVTLIVFPVITFYLMEAYTHNPFEDRGRSFLISCSLSFWRGSLSV